MVPEVSGARNVFPETVLKTMVGTNEAGRKLGKTGSVLLDFPLNERETG
jgi:hypothetical protein